MRGVDRAEPALSLALETANPDKARQAAAAAHALLTALRDSQPTRYDPADALEDALRPLEDSAHIVRIEELPPCRGDAEQVGAIAAMLITACELATNSLVALEAFVEDDLPQITMSLDGPGRFPDRLCAFGVLPVTLDELGPAWTRATDGGRMDRTPYGMRLTLSGMREPGRGEEGLGEAVASIGAARDAQTVEALREALACVDEADERQPAAVAALVERVFEERGADLAARAIRIEVLAEPGMPAIPLYRSRFERAAHSIADLAMLSAPEGAEAVVMLSYDEADCQALVNVELPARPLSLAAEASLASIKRAAAESHGGDVTFDCGDDALDLQASFPDPVGEALKTWIPGYEAFSEESVRLLRLLKSGGPAPPEDFVLRGVLENEQERRMLPALSTQLARNVAHEAATESTLPGGSSERLKKALGQVRKGKPRKEVARPPYAGELLWAFAGDERGRQALGLSRLDETDLRELAQATGGSEPRPLEALRLLAKSGPPTGQS